MNEQQKVLQGWLDKINTENEELVDEYLKNVFNTPITTPVEKIFYLSKNLSCISSFSLEGVKGHYELTKEVFENHFTHIITSPIAVVNFARASRLPDLLYFEELDYHAQSATNDNGNLIYRDRLTNINNFCKFLKAKLKELDISIEENHEEELFYYSGILLHAVQDLACHQGMTNPEHSNFNKKDKSPDKNSDLYELGYSVTKLFIEKHLSHKLITMSDKLNKYKSITWKNYFSKIGFIKLVYQAKQFNKIHMQWNELNTMRWFNWNSKKDNNRALDEIQNIIFSQLLK